MTINLTGGEVKTLAHINGIRKILEQFIHYHDADVELDFMEQLPQNTVHTIIDKEISDLLQQGKQARDNELQSEEFQIFKSIFTGKEFSHLEVETQIQVICNLIWYYGILQEFDKAQSYIEYVKNSEVLCQQLEKCSVLYAELLWNERQWEKALQLLDAHKKEEIRHSYLKLKEQYVNVDTYNLKNLKEYESLDNDMKKVEYDIPVDTIYRCDLKYIVVENKKVVC